MNKKVQIQKLLLEVLASKSIDDKRRSGNQAIKLFRDAKLIAQTPVALKLNTSLELKEAIDNFITYDNSNTRDALKNSYSFISQLLHDDKAA